MERKAVSVIMLTLLLVGILTFVSDIQPVKASGTIYIRADGSINPSTAPISSVDNVTYILTGNIAYPDYSGVVIERSDIVVDGFGHGLYGPGRYVPDGGNGFFLHNVSNVTIKNANIVGFHDGIYAEDSSNNTITENIIAGNGYSGEYHTWEGGGISLLNARWNSISMNEIDGNVYYGLSMVNSSYNLFLSNNVSRDRFYGMILQSSSCNNRILGNNISENNGYEYISGYGIAAGGLGNNTISMNNLLANSIGISTSSPFNVISENNVTSSWEYGILAGGSHNEICRNRIITDWGGGTGIGSGGSFNIISSNEVKVHYGDFAVALYSAINNTVSQNDIGQIGLFGSRNNMILENNYSSSTFLYDSNNNTYAGNRGYIRLERSSNNTLYENQINLIDLIESSDNKFYHNNINTVSFGYDISTKNLWDDGYPSGGNYWSIYKGVDLFKGPYQNLTGHDGIGDTPYIIDENNRDRYPFITPCPHPPWYPVASFVYFPLYPTIYESVTFNATDSYDIDGSIIGYTWNLGDGTILHESNPVINHTYSTAGTHTITLFVTDNDGLTGTLTKSITIARAPTFISISTSSSSAFVGFRVNVTGTLRDMYGNGLGNEIVVLYYTFSGVSTWIPITSDKTDNMGNYLATWIPTATGYFVLKAEWVGNATHLGASNAITLSSLVYSNQYVFSVESNSTISEIAFNTTDWALSFSATGPDGTRGYVEVTIAKILVADIANVKVYLDGYQTEYWITSSDGSWLLTFNYAHSTHQVVIDLGPERILGDMDGDCYVGPIDLNKFAAAYGKSRGQYLYNPLADLDSDGYIGPIDLNIFAANYGKHI